MLIFAVADARTVFLFMNECGHHFIKSKMETMVISKGETTSIVVIHGNNSNINSDMATTSLAKWKQQPVASCDHTALL